jgi:hypothetical protein
MNTRKIGSFMEKIDDFPNPIDKNKPGYTVIVKRW